MKRLALLLPLFALAAAPARAADPATNATPVYLASMLDLGSSSTARNQEVVTAEGVWLANLRDRHPGGCIRTIQALLATNGVEVRIDVLPGTEMKPVPTSNGIVRLEPVKLREWVNHENRLHRRLFRRRRRRIPSRLHGPLPLTPRTPPRRRGSKPLFRPSPPGTRRSSSQRRTGPTGRSRFWRSRPLPGNTNRDSGRIPRFSVSRPAKGERSKSGATRSRWERQS